MTRGALCPTPGVFVASIPIFPSRHSEGEGGEVSEPRCCHPMERRPSAERFCVSLAFPNRRSLLRLRLRPRHR
eukprot:scaffold2310_cov105-Isochrysis_galbana.AAC.4